MFMTIMPFACLGIGALLGFQKLPVKVYKLVDTMSTVALIILMLTIGGNIGTNKEVLNNLDSIGLNCAVTCLLAIGCSIIICLIIEKTILPLDEIKKKVYLEQESDQSLQIGENENHGFNAILWIIPISIILGAVGCYFFMDESQKYILKGSLIVSLVILYTSVGIGLGANKKVFHYIKLIGFKILYLSMGIFLGSILGGVIAGLLMKVPLHIAVTSASGMGYYSMTGATMMQYFGAEAGVYGFMVNVMRDFFTVLFLPIYVKICKSAAIASSAAGGMDTMLVPVTKVLGQELGLVTLITGVVATLAVPIILPLFCNLLG